MVESFVVSPESRGNCAGTPQLPLSQFGGSTSGEEKPAMATDHDWGGFRSTIYGDCMVILNNKPCKPCMATTYGHPLLTINVHHISSHINHRLTIY